MAHDYCICGANRGSCIDCAENKIDRLTAQLTEVKSSCKLSFDQICTLKIQISERDAEISELKDNIRLEIDVDQVRIDLELENVALRTKLADCEKEVDHIKQVEFPRRVEKLRTDIRKQAAMECIAIVDSYIGTDHICAEIAETFVLEE